MNLIIRDKTNNITIASPDAFKPLIKSKLEAISLNLAFSPCWFINFSLLLLIFSKILFLLIYILKFNYFHHTTVLNKLP